MSVAWWSELDAVARRRAVIVRALALALLLIGVGLRANEFLDYSLWLDEAWVGISAQTQTLNELLLGIASTPVLFVLSTRAALAVFQHPELGARFLPLAFSVVALALAFRLGQALHGSSAGLIALALATVSSAFVTYAKLLKQYSAEMMLALGIVWLALRAVESPSRRNTWALVAVAAVAPGFSHPAHFVNLAVVAARAFSCNQPGSVGAEREVGG